MPPHLLNKVHLATTMINITYNLYWYLLRGRPTFP